MSEKRFVQVGDTSIKDNLTGEKYYAPCEDGLLDLLNEQQSTIQSLKEENRKLRNIHLSIDLTYSYGFGRYLADVRVIDDE